MKRFWDKVNKNGPIPPKHPELGPCWIWMAGCSGDGYGAFWFNGKTVRSHRFSLQLIGRDIPEGMQPDHLCDVTRCINPAHLKVTTPRENVLRSSSPVANNANKTACAKGHPFEGENLIIRKGGKRGCRECTIDRKRRWRTANPGAYKEKDRARTARYYRDHKEEINSSRRLKC